MQNYAFIRYVSSQIEKKNENLFQKKGKLLSLWDLKFQKKVIKRAIADEKRKKKV
ncbi:MAG: hypothetical protein V4585_10605 [Bacteroidota bacterium]